MFKLSAVKREIKGEKVRKEGLLPAVIYGAGSNEAESVSLVYNDFIKLYNEAGESSLVDFDIDNKDAGKILIHSVQYDPVSGRVVHVDLRKIDMKETIDASIELVFINEAPAVKELGGTLVKNFDSIEVECLPKDLVNHIDIDLSVLKTFDDAITVADLSVPEGMKITDPSLDTVLTKVIPALSEEQIKAMEEKGSATEDVSKIESAAPKKEEEEVEDSAKKEDK
jgi:large subunit ribosomal protein L25